MSPRGSGDTTAKKRRKGRKRLWGYQSRHDLEEELVGWRIVPKGLPELCPIEEVEVELCHKLLCCGAEMARERDVSREKGGGEEKIPRNLLLRL